jgi:general secretion pathway protein A
MYEGYYGLSAKPFQLTPDPKFFFGSSGHKRAMSYLRYGLTQGEGFIIITGGIGTGKTMLVRTLFSELSKENIIAAQLVNTNLEAEDTLRMVAASFGLAHEGTSKAAILRNLETFLTARAREGKRALLVVDEAHNLPIESLEELRMLSNFQISGKTLIQSFLLGQEEFKDKLQSDRLEQLRQRVIAAYHLEPLSKEETKEYIEHRLKMVGWNGDPALTQHAFTEIYNMTSGVPRKINTFCDRLLLYGYLEELHSLGKENVMAVAQELQQETIGKGNAGAGGGGASDNQDEIAPAPESESLSSGIGIQQSYEAEQLGRFETRIALLEERIDSLERTLRRYLELNRK